MTDFVGYDAAPGALQLTQEQQNWFTQQEARLGRKIKVIFGGLRSQQREGGSASFERNDELVIYDCATSGSSEIEGRPNQRVFEQIELNVVDATRETYKAFPMREGRGIETLNSEKLLYTCAREDKAGPTWRNTIAEMDLGTIWTRFSLANFKRFQAGGPTRYEPFLNTDAVLDAFIKPMLDLVLNPDLVTKHHKDREEAARKVFIEQARRHATQRTSQLYSQIQQEELSLIENEEHHLQLLETLRAKQKEYDYLEQQEGIDESKLSYEYDELKKHAHVKRIEFDQASNKLQIFTDLLYLHSPDGKERTPAGEFRIDIEVSTRKMQLTNLTNKRGGRHHPHAPGSGRPCFGSISSTLAALQREGELIALMELTVRYLESYNPQDAWGRWGANWWIPQEEKEQQWLQKDGSWMTKAELEAGKGKKKEKIEPLAVDTELAQALAAGTVTIP